MPYQQKNKHINISRARMQPRGHAKRIVLSLVCAVGLGMVNLYVAMIGMLVGQQAHAQSLLSQAAHALPPTPQPSAKHLLSGTNHSNLLATPPPANQSDWVNLAACQQRALARFQAHPNNGNPALANRVFARQQSQLAQRCLIWLMLHASQFPVWQQERYAREFITRFPSHPFVGRARFVLGNARFMRQKPFDPLASLSSSQLEGLSIEEQLLWLNILAEDALRRRKFSEALGFLVQRAALAPNQEEQTAQRAYILQLLQTAANPENLQTILFNPPLQGSWLEEKQPLLLPWALFNAGEVEKANQQIADITAQGLVRDSADEDILNGLHEEQTDRQNTRPWRIGVLLPLHSRSKLLRSLAQQTLDGVRMALQLQTAHQPNTPRTRNARPELVIHYTDGSAAQAAQGVETLVRQHQVVAIIGPIAKRESERAAERAESLRIPLLSFSVGMRIPDGARWVFRHNQSMAQEIENLVRYAVHYRHARRFALLGPNNHYGEAFLAHFWRQVQAEGAQVSAAAAFTPAGKRIQRELGRELHNIFARLTALDRPLNQQEENLIARLKEQPDPLVDFEALLMIIGPNGTRNFQHLVSYPTTVNAEKAVILGDRYWNAPSVLLNSTNKLIEGVFRDSFDSRGLQSRTAAFRVDHQQMYGWRTFYVAPTPYTALGYETMYILNSICSVREATYAAGWRGCCAKAPFARPSPRSFALPTKVRLKKTASFLECKKGESYA